MTDKWAWIVDIALLLIIVVQGFGVWWLEYETYRMNRERYDERKIWREAKRRQQEKKNAPIETPNPSQTVDGSLQSDVGGQTKNA